MMVNLSEIHRGGTKLKWSRMSGLADIDDIRFLLFSMISISGAVVTLQRALPERFVNLDPWLSFVSLCFFSLSLIIWVVFSCYIKLFVPTELQVFKNSAQYLQYRKFLNEDEWTIETAANCGNQFYELTRMNVRYKTISAVLIGVTTILFLAGFLLFVLALFRAPVQSAATTALHLEQPVSRARDPEIGQPRQRCRKELPGSFTS